MLSPLHRDYYCEYYDFVIVVQIEANVPWQTRRATGGNWIAVCDPLRLTLQAETYADLMEDIGLTLDALLKDLLRTNELDRFLRDQGWTMVGSVPRRDDIRFDVPFFPAMMGDGQARQLHQ